MIGKFYKLMNSDPPLFSTISNEFKICLISVEEASTIPCVYSTVYYALVVRGKMKSGEKILIHAGSGGVGQAAISVSLAHGLEVFTTVGSQVKRDYLKKTFPQVKF